jgi:hypothetical protein
MSKIWRKTKITLQPDIILATLVSSVGTANSTSWELPVQKLIPTPH